MAGTQAGTPAPSRPGPLLPACNTRAPAAATQGEPGGQTWIDTCRAVAGICSGRQAGKQDTCRLCSINSNPVVLPSITSAITISQPPSLNPPVGLCTGTPCCSGGSGTPHPRPAHQRLAREGEGGNAREARHINQGRAKVASMHPCSEPSKACLSLLENPHTHTR